jgi:hypothetical protein
MKISIQMIVDPENGEPVDTKPIVEFQRDDLASDTLGLTIEESKTLLNNTQSEFIYQQIREHIHKNKTCKKCHKELKLKGYTEIVYRTLFGKFKLQNPRLYTCSCNKNHKQKSFSLLSSLFPERVSPELQYLQAKWSSLVSYGVTSNILADLLPMHANISSIYYKTHKIAQQLDAEINEEKHYYANGCQAEIQELPYPDSPLTVGLDGGYIHAREGNNRKAGWFEAIVGKSLQENKPSKRFGFVCKYDDKPKSRLNTMLQKQGLQRNQDITFLSDGGDTVRNLQKFISPQSEHILDWFHITMKITVMRQSVKGFSKKYRDELDKQLESIKWNIWHGNVDKALDKTRSFCEDIECQQLEQENKEYKLQKLAEEFYNYIKFNKDIIPNYGERYRYNEIISTSFVEATVNEVISKRMVKKQQMRWTQEGAHRMIQVRTSTLNNELRDSFCKWYPSMQRGCDENNLQSAA